MNPSCSSLFILLETVALDVPTFCDHAKALPGVLPKDAKDLQVGLVQFDHLVELFPTKMNVLSHI